MKVTKMKIILKKLLLLLWANTAQSSVSGLSYTDPFKISVFKSNEAPGEDPCNPLYWYPKNIPEYCNLRTTMKPSNHEDPPAAIPLAPPVLMPMLPPAVPILSINPPPLVAAPPSLSLIPAQLFPPILPLAPNTYPLISPIAHEFGIPSSSHSLPYYSSVIRSSSGMVPGLPGLVTRDGGVNIMPFSDVYADMLEKHKNKMIRRKLHKILDKYEFNSYSRNYKNLQKYEKYFTNDDY